MPATNIMFVETPLGDWPMLLLGASACFLCDIGAPVPLLCTNMVRLSGAASNPSRKLYINQHSTRWHVLCLDRPGRA